MTKLMSTFGITGSACKIPIFYLGRSYLLTSTKSQPDLFTCLLTYVVVLLFNVFVSKPFVPQTISICRRKSTYM